MNMTSSYPFYVKLESSENLMLGQHVYVEVDTGDQTEKEGLWISFWYVNDLNSKPFVWADNGKGKLEKRTVEVGEIDEFSGLVQILGGLTGEDHITWPEEGLEEGMPTVVTTDGTMGQSNPAYDEMENWEEESEFMGESGAWLEEEGDGALMQETEGIEMSESGVE